jgi:hypothetical protein
MTLQVNYVYIHTQHIQQTMSESVAFMLMPWKYVELKAELQTFLNLSIDGNGQLDAPAIPNPPIKL